MRYVVANVYEVEGEVEEGGKPLIALIIVVAYNKESADFGMKFS